MILPPYSDEQLAKFRADTVTMMETYSHGHVPETIEFTCDACPLKRDCEYVFEPYNTNGDCLADK